MKKILNYILLTIISFICISCKDDFSPYSDLEQNFMVYCVLDNRLNSQIAILQNFHNSDNKNNITRAVNIFLSEGAGSKYNFKDTVIDRNLDYSYYYIPNYKLKRGLNYRLTAVVNGMNTQYGEIKYPKDPILVNYHTMFLDDVPITDYIYHLPGTDTMSFPAFKVTHDREVTAVSAFKFFVEYEIHDGNKITQYQKEVPIKLKVDREYNMFNDTIPNWDWPLSKVIEVYPYIQGENEFPGYRETDGNGKSYFYIKEEVFYQVFKYKMPTGQQKSSNIHIRRAYAVFYSIDEILYDKMNNPSNAQYFMRLDEPIYWTNIKTNTGNGYGYFSATGADTTVFDLPTEMISKFGFTNDQKEAIKTIEFGAIFIATRRLLRNVKIYITANSSNRYHKLRF